MTLSDEGLMLVSRFALLVVLIVIAAVFRTAIGQGKRRGRIAAMGTVGGIAFGILVAVPVSRWVGADVSAISACIGIVLGWAVSWLYARDIPREA